MLHTLGQGGGGGGGGGISLQQILQILFVVLIFGGSFLQWLFKKLAEKAAERERTIARQRQQEEALRTGRTDGQPLPQAAPIPGSTDDAKRRLQEIAAKRRAQLEQAARGQSPSPAPPPAPVPPVLAPAPQPAAPRPPRPKAKPSQRQRQERERAAAEARAAEPRRSAQPAPAPSRRQLAPQTASARELAVTAAGLAVDSPREAPGPAPAPRTAMAEMVATGGTATDWRKAFIMAELLKRPLSDREFDEP